MLKKLTYLLKMFGSNCCNVQNMCITLINTELESAFINHSQSSQPVKKWWPHLGKILCNIAKQVKDFIHKTPCSQPCGIKCTVSVDLSRLYWKEPCWFQLLIRQISAVSVWEKDRLSCIVSSEARRVSLTYLLELLFHTCSWITSWCQYPMMPCVCERAIVDKISDTQLFTSSPQGQHLQRPHSEERYNWGIHNMVALGFAYILFYCIFKCI